MKHAFTLLAALAMVFGALAAPPALAQGDPSAQIDAYFINLMKSENFGGQVLVAKDGKVIFEKVYGMANREHDVANTRETKFALQDVGLVVTAAAVMLLQNQGKLNVNDPICRYLDSCPKTWEPITIKQLLNWTSGISNYLSQPKMKAEMHLRHTPNQLIDMFKKLPLMAEPGNTRYTFTNSSNVLLGKIIEKVSGTTYAQFVKDNIFDKLGMTNTGVDDTTRVLKNRAEGYVGANMKGQFVDASNYYGSGGLYSTAGDLFTFQQALNDGKLLPAALAKEMMTPSTSKFSDDYPYQMGYGYLINTIDGHPYSIVDNRQVYDDGNIAFQGFGGGIMNLPDQKVTLVLLSNSSHSVDSLYQAAKPWLAALAK